MFRAGDNTFAHKMIKKLKASLNLSNVIVIDYEPVRCFVFEVKGGGQAVGRAVRYHSRDFSLPSVFYGRSLNVND